MKKIQWTDETWNPVTGCSKVSAGCKHCYAEGVANRFWGDRRFTDVQCHPERLDQPLRWRKPRRVFVNSMSDLFHPDVPDSVIIAVFGVMAAARRHTFQVLTKRPERMRALLGSGDFQATVADLVQDDPILDGGYTGWPLPNVWLGVSVEDQAAADQRIPVLLDTPAAVRFLSCEPLLGPVDLSRRIGGVDWVIVGGESGPWARPMDVTWAMDLVSQCQEAGVPVFVKQLGARPTLSGLPVEVTRAGGDPEEWPPDLRVREWPEARRLLPSGATPSRGTRPSGLTTIAPAGSAQRHHVRRAVTR